MPELYVFEKLWSRVVVVAVVLLHFDVDVVAVAIVAVAVVAEGVGGVPVDVAVFAGECIPQTREMGRSRDIL
jgi:hypothetical protein